MDTFVLIPREMILVSRRRTQPSLLRKDPANTSRRVEADDEPNLFNISDEYGHTPSREKRFPAIIHQESSRLDRPGVSADDFKPEVAEEDARIAVTVFSNQQIEKGARFFPFQGDVCFASMPITSSAAEGSSSEKTNGFVSITSTDDYGSDLKIRRLLGLFDKTETESNTGSSIHSTTNSRRTSQSMPLAIAPSVEISPKPVRRCNWIAFLRISSDIIPGTSTMNNNFNVIARSFNGQPMFEAVKSIAPCVELVAFVDPQSLSLPSPTEAYRTNIARILKDGPIDLSRQLLYGGVNTHLSSQQQQYSSSVFNSSSLSLIDSSEKVAVLERIRGRNRSGPSRTCRILLPCQVCGKAFDRPSLLKRHMRTHTGEKPHVCDVCEKAFSASSSLNTHRRIHSGERPHQCPFCGKRFTASSNLYYHRMTHSKDKPYKCRVCHKSFSTPGDLRSHAYTHSGAWPYRCNQCHRGFSKVNALRHHVDLHSSPGEFEMGQLPKQLRGDSE